MIRYKHLIRLLAIMSLDQQVNFADILEENLDKLSEDEVRLLVYGTPEQMTEVINKHNTPFQLVDLICLLINGEPVHGYEDQQQEEFHVDEDDEDDDSGSSFTVH